MVVGEAAALLERTRARRDFDELAAAVAAARAATGERRAVALAELEQLLEAVRRRWSPAPCRPLRGDDDVARELLGLEPLEVPPC